jgi:hypothetical protein
MFLRVLARLLQHAAVLSAAPAFLRRIYGVEKWPGLLPSIDLRWVDEPYWWTLAACLGIAAASISYFGSRTSPEWGGFRPTEIGDDQRTYLQAGPAGLHGRDAGPVAERAPEDVRVTSPSRPA